MGSSKHSERDMDVPLLKFEGEDKNEKSSKNSIERDVHLHEAGLIREQRLALLRKYQEEIQTIASRTH